MKDGDPTPIRINVRHDEVAPESIPTLPHSEIVPVQPETADRITGFRTMLVTVFEAEKFERDLGQVQRFGDAVDGKVTNPYLRLDSRYRNIWNHQADRLFEELSEDEATKQALLDIRNQLKAQYDGPPAMSATEARRLFER